MLDKCIEYAVYSGHDTLVYDLEQARIQAEREMQVLWKFDQNDGFIRFWDSTWCRCPKLDNEDRFPHGHYVISKGCKLHYKE